MTADEHVLQHGEIELVGLFRESSNSALLVDVTDDDGRMCALSRVTVAVRPMG